MLASRDCRCHEGRCTNGADRVLITVLAANFKRSGFMLAMLLCKKEEAKSQLQWKLLNIHLLAFTCYYCIHLDEMPFDEVDQLLP